MKAYFEEISVNGRHELSKYEALVWIHHFSINGGIHGSTRLFAEKWRWTKSRAERFLKELVQRGYIRPGDNVGTFNPTFRQGRLSYFEVAPDGPGTFASPAAGHSIPNNASNGTLKEPDTPELQPNNANGSDSSGTLANFDPLSSSLVGGCSPLLGGGTPLDKRRSQDEEEEEIVKIENQKSINLPIGDNYEFEGKHVKLTKADYGQLCKTYPGQNVMSMARYSDKVFPQRKNKKLDGMAYLEGRLMYADRDLRAAEATPAQKGKGLTFMQCQTKEEKQHWWRTRGMRMIKKGGNPGYSSQSLPWEAQTDCPPGTFTKEQMREMKEKFYAIIDKQRAEIIRERDIARSRNLASQHLNGQSQNDLPKLH